MIALRPEQCEALASAGRVDERRERLLRLRSERAEVTLDRSDATLLAVIDEADAFCAREHVFGEDARWTAVLLVLHLGIGFDRDPDRFSVHAVLRDPAILSGDLKVERLFARLIEEE